jgi:replication factor C subunit 3/5|tara:strand:+ start:3624 stop:4565 length:942 start_codon:yes stop_codon:yes gene_type:complete
MNKKNNIPWVEKYRPVTFDTIILDSINKKIFKNILGDEYFPNLLLYGPPGTGKTTTIINLINEYQNNNIFMNSNILHLNASDERGIDIIRNQILQFVKTQNFFNIGLKFVILDEVDYMTKNAQQALKYLLQTYNYNVRFCLICNYISKIDESLKNEFICVRFNQLPYQEIYNFIQNIIASEKLNISKEIVDNVIQMFNTDVRSMINYLQLNQNITTIQNNNYISNNILLKIYTLIKTDSYKNCLKYINNIHQTNNIDIKSIIKQFFKYIIREKSDILNTSLLDDMEIIIHSNDNYTDQFINYFIHNFQKKLKN